MVVFVELITSGQNFEIGHGYFTVHVILFQRLHLYSFVKSPAFQPINL